MDEQESAKVTNTMMKTKKEGKQALHMVQKRVGVVTTSAFAETVADGRVVSPASDFLLSSFFLFFLATHTVAFTDPPFPLHARASHVEASLSLSPALALLCCCCADCYDRGLSLPLFPFAGGLYCFLFLPALRILCCSPFCVRLRFSLTESPFLCVCAEEEEGA